MKGVDTIARIRREFFIRGRSIKEIVRDLHVSRNTVRKVVRTGRTAFEYEREVQPMPKLGQWRADLDELLAANDSKAARERLTMIRVFEELRGRGYAGGYDAVRRYARGWRRERVAVTAAAYVPLSFDPGEAYQFDWSHEIVLINGTTVTIKVPVRRRPPCEEGGARSTLCLWTAISTVSPPSVSRSSSWVADAGGQMRRSSAS